jgi:hypothetical protein
LTAATTPTTVKASSGRPAVIEPRKSRRPIACPSGQYRFAKSS